MATKSIAWNTGSGNITLTYQGQGDGTISVESDANDIGSARSQVITVETTDGVVTRNLTVSQAACPVPVGTILNYQYTGSVQNVTLPAGKYKLQCWGAQGGSGNGYSGGKGGYSEGIVTLSQSTTFYVFVGGQGSTSGNGGWNGGGGGSGSSSYSSGDEYGSSSFGCGGGATDIALTTSSMSYSSYRTNRSSASLKSRMIVAGGGSGGAYGYQEIESSSLVTTLNANSMSSWTHEYQSSIPRYYCATDWASASSGSYFNHGSTVRITVTLTKGSLDHIEYYYKNGNTKISQYYSVSNGEAFTVSSLNQDRIRVFFIGTTGVVEDLEGSYTFERLESSTTTDTDSQVGYVGGGTTGGGYSSTYKGKQNGAGSNGGFGYGANQAVTNYRYAAGCGGGGWYGGGNAYSDSGLSTIQCSGGGSGFVNTAANASYRPSGYTGLQLDSGETKAGNTSFPSTSGGNETGHSGNGYARITRIS